MSSSKRKKAAGGAPDGKSTVDKATPDVKDTEKAYMTVKEVRDYLKTTLGRGDNKPFNRDDFFSSIIMFKRLTDVFPTHKHRQHLKLIQEVYEFMIVKGYTTVKTNGTEIEKPDVLVGILIEEFIANKWGQSSTKKDSDSTEVNDLDEIAVDIQEKVSLAFKNIVQGIDVKKFFKQNEIGEGQLAEIGKLINLPRFKFIETMIKDQETYKNVKKQIEEWRYKNEILETSKKQMSQNIIALFMIHPETEHQRLIKDVLPSIFEEYDLKQYKDVLSDLEVGRRLPEPAPATGTGKTAGGGAWSKLKLGFQLRNLMIPAVKRDIPKVLEAVKGLNIVAILETANEFEFTSLTNEIPNEEIKLIAQVADAINFSAFAGALTSLQSSLKGYDLKKTVPLVEILNETNIDYLKFMKAAHEADIGFIVRAFASIDYNVILKDEKLETEINGRVAKLKLIDFNKIADALDSNDENGEYMKAKDEILNAVNIISDVTGLTAFQGIQAFDSPNSLWTKLTKQPQSDLDDSVNEPTEQGSPAQNPPTKNPEPADSHQRDPPIVPLQNLEKEVAPIPKEAEPPTTPKALLVEEFRELCPAPVIKEQEDTRTEVCKCTKIKPSDKQPDEQPFAEESAGTPDQEPSGEPAGREPTADSAFANDEQPVKEMSSARIEESVATAAVTAADKELTTEPAAEAPAAGEGDTLPGKDEAAAEAALGDAPAPAADGDGDGDDPAPVADGDGDEGAPVAVADGDEAAPDADGDAPAPAADGDGDGDAPAPVAAAAAVADGDEAAPDADGDGDAPAPAADGDGDGDAPAPVAAADGDGDGDGDAPAPAADGDEGARGAAANEEEAVGGAHGGANIQNIAAALSRVIESGKHAMHTLPKMKGGSPPSPLSPEEQVKAVQKKLADVNTKWRDLKSGFDEVNNNIVSFYKWLINTDENSYDAFKNTYTSAWLEKITNFEKTSRSEIDAIKSVVEAIIDKEAGFSNEKKIQFMKDFNLIINGDFENKENDVNLVGLYKTFVNKASNLYQLTKAFIQKYETEAKRKDEMRVQAQRNAHRDRDGNLLPVANADEDKNKIVFKRPPELIAEFAELVPDALNDALKEIRKQIDQDQDKELKTKLEEQEKLYGSLIKGDKKIITAKIHERHEIFDKLFKAVGDGIKASGSPALMLTSSENLFAKILNEYLSKKDLDPGAEYFQREKLVETLHANQLVPNSVLKVNKMDKIVFVFLTLFMRLFCLTVIESMIEKGYIKTITAATFGFFGLYTLIFVAFTMMVNVDLYRLRIVFNMMNMHANGGYVYMHLGMLWLFGCFIYLVLSNLNVFGAGMKIIAISEYEKQVLISKLELLSLIVWVLLTIVIVLM